jgi:hypothetical protein
MRSGHKNSSADIPNEILKNIAEMELGSEYHWDVTSANPIFHYTSKYCLESGFAKAKTPEAVNPRALTNTMIEVRWKDSEATTRENQPRYQWLTAKVLKYDENHTIQDKPLQFKVKYEDGDCDWHNLDKKVWRLKEPYDEVVEKMIAFYKQYHSTKKRPDVEKLLDDPRWVNDLVQLKESLRIRYGAEPDFSNEVLSIYVREPKEVTTQKKKAQEEEAVAKQKKAQMEAAAKKEEDDKAAALEKVEAEARMEENKKKHQKEGSLHFLSTRALGKPLWKSRFVKLNMHALEVWKSDGDHEKKDSRIILVDIKKIDENPKERTSKGETEFWITHQGAPGKADKVHKIKASTVAEKMEWVSALETVKSGEVLAKKGGEPPAELPKPVVERKGGEGSARENNALALEAAADVVRTVKSVLRILMDEEKDFSGPGVSEEAIQTVFKLIDSDSSGSITPLQLEKGLLSIDFAAESGDVYAMFAKLDIDKSGSLEYDEFKDGLEKEQARRKAVHEMEKKDKEKQEANSKRQKEEEEANSKRQKEEEEANSKRQKAEEEAARQKEEDIRREKEEEERREADEGEERRRKEAEVKFTEEEAKVKAARAAKEEEEAREDAEREKNMTSADLLARAREALPIVHSKKGQSMREKVITQNPELLKKGTKVVVEFSKKSGGGVVWTEGTIGRYDPNHTEKKGKPAVHEVNYADGDNLWQNLTKRNWRLVDEYAEVEEQLLKFQQEHSNTIDVEDVHEVLTDPEQMGDLFQLGRNMAQKHQCSPPDFSARILRPWMVDVHGEKAKMAAKLGVDLEGDSGEAKRRLSEVQGMTVHLNAAKSESRNRRFSTVAAEAFFNIPFIFYGARL